MQRYSSAYTIGFAAAVCVVCSVFVAGAAVLLKDKQEENKVLDRRRQVLVVAGLVGEGEQTSARRIQELFAKHVTAKVIDLASGAPADGISAADFDQASAAKDPKTSKPAPPNAAGVARLPVNATVYEIRNEGAENAIILPIEGKGLWSTLYGYLALASDGNTVKGITFYQHGETPGLGGEVDNVRWKGLWPGRKAFAASGEPAIGLKKGPAGSVEEDPHHVDGISGATITSTGVTNLVRFWLGDDGFAPFLKRFRADMASNANKAGTP